MLCDRCPLLTSPQVHCSGSFEASLVLVGEAPGAEEVEQGKPFVGRSGQLLDKLLEAEGFDPENTFRTNVVMCRPPGNRTPTDEEVAACRSRLTVELMQTTGTILTLGNTAKDAVAGLGLTGRRVVNAWHPAYVLRKPSAVSGLRDSIRLAIQKLPTHLDPAVVVPKDRAELETLLGAVPDGDVVAFDLETDNVNWYDKPEEPRSPILLLALCWRPDFAVIVTDDLLYDDDEVPATLQLFFDRVQLVGHNAKFDAVFLQSHIGVRAHIAFDTMLAHYILDETGRHGLKELAVSLLGMPNYEDQLIKQYLRSRNDAYSLIPFEPLAKYSALDVATTLTFYELFKRQLTEQGLYERPFLLPLIEAENALVSAELHGIAIDVPYLRQCQLELEAELAVIVSEARAIVGRPNLNMNSPDQLAVVLYDQLGLKVVVDKHSNPRTTAHEALVQLEGQHPFVDALQHYRRVAKIKSSYIDNLLEAVDTHGRVHPTFKLHGAETGRISITDPAAQTFPRPSDYYGKMIRRAIIAPPGHKLGLVDYSQAEFRVFAALSGDPNLIRAYREGRDMHAEVAISMYGPNYTKEDRATVKMFNFAYIYGGSEYSFARDLGIPIAQAKEWVKRYNATMPVAVQWKREQFLGLKRNGYVETVFGRRRRFPLLTAENVDEARKAAVNMPIQGTASDLTLIAATRATREGIHVELLVHDSILIEAPDDKIQQQTARIIELMIEVGNEFVPAVPWKVDYDIMQEWYEGEKD